MTIEDLAIPSGDFFPDSDHVRSHPSERDTLLLFELTKATNRAESLEDVYGPALDAIRDATNADRASILLFDPDDVMRFKAWRGLADEYRRAVEGHTPWSRHDLDPDPLVVSDVERDASLADYLPLFRRHDIRALVFVPITYRRQVLGKFMVYYREPHVATDLELSLTTTIAAQVAQAVARSLLLASEREAHERARRAHLEAEAARQRADFLAEAGSRLSASLDYESTLRGIAELAVPRIADWCIVSLADGPGEEMREIVAHEDPAKVEHMRALRAKHPPSPPEQTGVLHVIATGRSCMHEPLGVEHLRADSTERERHLVTELGVCSGVCVPIAASERRYGVVTLLYAESGRHYSDADLHMAEQLGRRIGLAIENSLLYRAETAARRDAQLAEAALADANRRKDEFLAVLAHELRNPLAPIRNAVHIMRKSGPREPVLDRAREMIDRQVTHMTRMVDDLLDVSRITRGKVLLQTQAVDLVALARDTVEDHRTLLEAGGLSVRTALPEGPVWVNGDPTRLAQALGNLLTNAGKFTDAGGEVVVHASVDGGRVRLAVRDTGIGVQPELLDRMFDAFTQGEQTLARSRGGLGLGLALVKGLVDLHHGRVHADSRGIGHGTEIVIELPTIAAPPRSVTPRPCPPDGCRRVLIIEDNVDAADSLAALLELEGHQVTIARDGRSGVERAAREAPEVVLCDLGLPGELDGFGVARALRAIPDLADIHLVALTGYGHAEDRARTREVGFELHLTKPVDPDALHRLLLAL